MAMPADGDKLRESLLKEMTQLKNRDERWGGRNFIIAQIQGWITIVASFGSAIAAAAKAPSIAVAIIAAVPGTVILIDRNFGFMRRAQWHWLEAAKLLQLEHALNYQGAKVDEISKRYTSLRADMEEKFPITGPDLSPKRTTDDESKPQSGEINEPIPEAKPTDTSGETSSEH
jgi:hypothetical protein